MKELIEKMEKDLEDRRIKFPITVQKVEWADDRGGWSRSVFHKPGTPVSIRPCAKEYGDKTYFGVLLGDFDIGGGGVSWVEDEGVLKIHGGLKNPGIWVPELNRVIFGAESYWGAIKSEDELREITDEDISGVWYVKALKAMAEAEAKEGSEGKD